MRAGEKLEEYGRVDRKVAANPALQSASCSGHRTEILGIPKAPKSCEAADCSKVWRASSDESEDAGDAKGEIEGPFSAKDIAAEPPEDSSCKKSNILRQSQERRTRRIELVGDGSDYRMLGLARGS